METRAVDRPTKLPGRRRPPLLQRCPTRPRPPAPLGKGWYVCFFQSKPVFIQVPVPTEQANEPSAVQWGCGDQRREKLGATCVLPCLIG